MNNPLLILLLIITFLGGLYYCAKSKEGFLTNDGELRCPDLLVQKGSKYYLYNSKVAKVPGVNPIMFNNLEDYTEFLDWQRSQGIRCPVLYLQQSYDTQGNRVFKARPSVSDLYGGLPPVSSTMLPPVSAAMLPHINSAMLTEQPSTPVMYPDPTLLVDATRDDAPFNQNSYPAYDPSSFYIGKTTPLDQMNIIQRSKPLSPNAMDDNWGGDAYTKKLVDSGYYAGNEVYIRPA